MSQEVEIEFKNMLTKDEYVALLSAYELSKEDIKTQTNDYFDTKDFLLREKGAALRVRSKNNTLFLTLKEPASEGLLETHQSITQDTFDFIKSKGQLPEGEVQEQLHNLGVHTELLHLGSLTTHRAERTIESGLLVLDRSEYLGREDFELEFEVTKYEEGKRAFQTLLKQHHIKERNAKNKILRFFLASQEQG
ncbi:CYTH domain-containing protein [Pseudalkalibacillus hwajinpoensis]|uniref:CYTH domain-containing protein n=1 Tax=Guptibacillus hwajinpoensis TaxID=208199 RepID=A0A4U1MME7_9BACL|nr:CYTH domain-containing protein [Pseudalkalibacillus hwajinpoensis]TKD71881.1 CYTH domain-containing protein [Pseudalkalibacillus hwajinpoensis]